MKIKNYFEVDGFIVPFDKVIGSHQAHIDYGVHNMRCYYSNDRFFDVSVDDFANYKAWLDSQSNHSEIPTGCTYSEKDTSRDFVLTRMQAKSVLSVLESIAIQKNTALEDAYNVLKDRLGSISKVYQSYYTCSEKANDSNTPINVTILTKKQQDNLRKMFQKEIAEYQNRDILLIDDSLVETVWDNTLYWIETNLKQNNSNHLHDVGKMVLSRDILQEIVDKAGCTYCTVDHLSQDCKNCYSYSNIKISDDFVKEINELINEV